MKTRRLQIAMTPTALAQFAEIIHTIEDYLSAGSQIFLEKNVLYVLALFDTDQVEEQDRIIGYMTEVLKRSPHVESVTEYVEPPIMMMAENTFSEEQVLKLTGDFPRNSRITFENPIAERWSFHRDSKPE